MEILVKNNVLHVICYFLLPLHIKYTCSMRAHILNIFIRLRMYIQKISCTMFIKNRQVHCTSFLDDALF